MHGNTREGGAIVLGLSKDGERPRATVDGHELRRRVYEISRQSLTVNADEHRMNDGTRVRILRVPEQLEPIRVDGVINWRYDDSCHEVDPSTWHATIGLRGRDWSREPATETIDDVDDEAVAALRFFLRSSGEPARVEMSDLPRDGLLLAAVEARGIITHVESSTGATGQFRHLPQRPVREAIVNAITHRDWHDPGPTTVEQTGQTLRITSPGDLVGSVTVDNILTHRSEPRYPALAEALTHVRVAEREGIGVDRMYGDMLALGHPVPQISDGDRAVEVVLLGGPQDPRPSDP